MILSTIDVNSSCENCEIAPQFVEVFHESLPFFLYLILLVTGYQSTWLVAKCSSECFLSVTLFQLLVALTHLLETCCCHQIQHELICFFNEIKYLSLDISCFLCSTVNHIWIWDCHINYFPHARTRSQDFWNWSCRNLVYNTSMPTMCPSFILSDLQVCADTNTSCVWPRWRRATSLGYNFHVLWCKFQNCEGLCPHGCLILSPLQTPGEPTASIHSCYISELCPFKRLVTRNVPKI